MPTQVNAAVVAVGTEASGRHGIVADLLVGLGAAYLAYIGPWSHLLTLTRADLFWMQSPPPASRHVALVLSTAILGILVFLAIRAARRRSAAGAIARALLCVFAALSVNAVRDLLAGYYPELFGGNLLRALSGAEVWIALGIIATLGTLGARRFRAVLVPLARHALGALAVLGLFYMAQALYRARASEAAFPDGARGAFLPGRAPASPKLVWVVFDEFDYRLAFVNRLPGLRLPVLERFSRSAITASQAYPPSGNTSTSMLAYLLGKRVVSLHPQGGDDLSLGLEGESRTTHWKALPNLFAEARQAGVNGAVVGWYLPYSRLLGGDVVDCWWFDKRVRDGAVGAGISGPLLNYPRTLIETSLLSPFGQSLLTRRRVGLFKEFMGNARRLAADPRVGLLLLHIPVPHTPYFYDRRTGQNTLGNSLVSGYWDALALVDKTLGDIEGDLKAAGQWDNAAVLVTSDHFYRTAQRLDGRIGHRVPFLLKMPGQTRPLAFDEPFNTVLAHDLALDILRGRVQDSEQAAEWLDRSRADVPLGWTVEQAALSANHVP